MALATLNRVGSGSLSDLVDSVPGCLRCLGPQVLPDDGGRRIRLRSSYRSRDRR